VTSGWVPNQAPDSIGPIDYARLATSFHGQVNGNVGPRTVFLHSSLILQNVLGLDVLYSHPTHWVQVFTSWHGQIDIYVTGPYVLVQERKLAYGLLLSTGPDRPRRRARVGYGPAAMQMDSDGFRSAVAQFRW
jgi:hypothetical protein